MSEKTVLNFMMDQIVNPKCDECGASLNFSDPLEGLRGPHLCLICKMFQEEAFKKEYKDFLSQERPRNRSVHVVKLPEGFKFK